MAGHNYKAGGREPPSMKTSGPSPAINMGPADYKRAPQMQVNKANWERNRARGRKQGTLARGARRRGGTMRGGLTRRVRGA